MKFTTLTLFENAYQGLKVGIIEDAIQKGIISLDVVNVRDFSLDKHKHCDDTPYGGGAGMVMSVEPIIRALNAVDSEHKALRIFVSPRGKQLDQTLVEELSTKEHILFLAGNYEGVDQRVIDNYIDMEISIGDYVLTSGDLPIMVIINAVSRYVEGVLGSSDSLCDESFSGYLLEYPQYTKPSEYDGMNVPEVLLSGNHKEIDKWRINQRISITQQLRPDLYKKYIESLPPEAKSKKRK